MSSRVKEDERESVWNAWRRNRNVIIVLLVVLVVGGRLM